MHQGTHPSRLWIRRSAVLAAAVAVMAAAAPSGSAAESGQQRVTGPTSESAAESGDTTPQTYVVQMALDPVATYEGDIAGLPATRQRDGSAPDPSAPAVRKYADHLKGRHRDALAKVDGGEPLYDYVYTFDGFAAELTEGQAADLADQPGVVTVRKDELREVDTASTPSFLGLDDDGGLWDRLGGPTGGTRRSGAGEDIVIGVIDSGIWPASGSFSDRDEAGKRMYWAKPRGFRGRCESAETVGDDSWDANLCNHKLLAARHFNAGWGGDEGLKAQRPWEFASPRDYNGHGTHTASTAGGNHGVAVTGPAAAFGSVSGIAPRARIAAYKALWSTEDAGTANGYTSDLVAAVDQAVADGVDVINYSVSGTSTDFLDPVEVAFLNAADAGVFVAASAGNSGPSSATVAHPSPWVTTVAAGTHGRTTSGEITLGDGTTYTGASVASSAVGPVSFIDGADAGLAGADATEAARCYSAADNGGEPVLDPAKVEGKIVLCERAGVTARVNKSQAVADAGGAGVVLVNSADNTQNSDFHAVPTVHLAHTALAHLRAYASTAGATASIAVATVDNDADAPYTAEFSSRGPLRAGNGDLIKPDLIAPGQDILAAVAPPGSGGMDFNLYSGTSMSAPHVAGLAALLAHLHPDWSPMAIKSALMTTGSDVRDGEATDPSVIFKQGAGHIEPNNAADPGLVYDSDADDWLAFLCGTTSGVVDSVCNDLGEAGHSFDPSDLNTPSIGIGLVDGAQTVTREVTNVDDVTATYTASVAGLEGVDVTVEPSTLTLEPGETASFTVTLTQRDADTFAYLGGQLSWTDGTHDVRSPIVLRLRQAGEEDWTARYDGPGNAFGFASDYGSDVLVHPDGERAYALATSVPAVPGVVGSDLVTVAYEPETGRELWRATIAGGGGGFVSSHGFDLSPDGETVYVAGTAEGDYVAAAFDGATGEKLWETTTDGAGGSDTVGDVAVAPDGTTFYVTGSHVTGEEGGHDYGTVAYDTATGAELWVAHYDDPVHGLDSARGVAVSPDSSTVVVTGQSRGDGTYLDAATVAYDASTGDQIWAVLHNGPANKGDIGEAIGVAADGTVVVLASVAGIGTGVDMATIGYDVATGEQRWLSTYDGTASATDVPRGLTITSDGGTAVVVGNSWGQGTHSDYVTVAVDVSTGEQRWAARHNGSANGLDIGEGLAVTDDGSRVVVTGSTTETVTGSDYTTIAYDMASGEQIWSARYDATAVADGGSAVAVGTGPDGERRVFVAGSSAISFDREYGMDTNVDATTVAYLDPFE